MGILKKTDTPRVAAAGRKNPHPNPLVLVLLVLVLVLVLLVLLVHALEGLMTRSKAFFRPHSTIDIRHSTFD